jgi:hypothetical protein
MMDSIYNIAMLAGLMAVGVIVFLLLMMAAFRIFGFADE